MISLMAGESGPTAIALWARLKENLLLKLLPLPNGIPRKDAYRRFRSALKPDAFQGCFVNWLSSLRASAAAVSGVEQPILAVDGKTLRRSHAHSRGLGALDSVSLWATDFGLTLGQVATNQTLNEITAIPELLRLVGIKGVIITIDAMGTQKSIAKQIIAAEAHLVLALKGNQSKRHSAVIAYVDEQIDNDFADVAARQIVTKGKGHGREEAGIYTFRCQPSKACRAGVCGQP